MSVIRYKIMFIVYVIQFTCSPFISTVMLNSVNKCFSPKNNLIKKKKNPCVTFICDTKKAYYTTKGMLSEAPAFPFKTSGHCDEQWTHLLCPLLQLVCEHDAISKLEYNVPGKYSTKLYSLI